MSRFLKQYNERGKLLRKYGYDIVSSREFIIQKTQINNSSILEIGTGKGYLALTLAKKGHIVHTIDMDQDALRFTSACARVMGLNKKIILKKMDAESLSYQDGAFDCVISVNLVHHLRNPKKCLKEMMRVAKDKIVVADLNKRGADILRKVHAAEGHKHEETKIPLPEIKEFFKKKGLAVKTYRHPCQTVFVCQKGKRT